MHNNKIIVAMDGHSSCGKSTMARKLAAEIGYTYIDTGAMYRAVTLYALREGMFLPGGEVNEEALQKALPSVGISFQKEPDGTQSTLLNGENVEREIRSLEVSGKVSLIAAIGFVRSAMVDAQRKFSRSGGVVMDGRDIGTVVFPQAELKLFVTAAAEVRARRRFDEMVGKGETPLYEDILKNVQERDWIDSHREISPLRPAPDALILDNSNMTMDEQNAWVMDAFIRAVSRSCGNNQ